MWWYDSLTCTQEALFRASCRKQKEGLEAQIAAGGWGEAVPAGSVLPGDLGPAVIALRDRLVER